VKSAVGRPRRQCAEDEEHGSLDSSSESLARNFLAPSPPLHGLPLLLRDGEFGYLFGVSVRQVAKWRREGLITGVQLPGICAVRYSKRQALKLARDLERTAGITEESDAV
jgi:hypothetical protein